jgi:predicted glycoside hydrolase/deacetylase ChbG (UPF0249 family)
VKINNRNVILHVDDAGICSNSNSVILELIATQKVDAVSVCVNTAGFEDFSIGLQRLFKSNLNLPEVWLHSNLIEGSFTAKKKGENVCAKTIFPTSFAKLLAQYVFLKKSARQRITESIYLEIKSQLMTLKSQVPYLVVRGLDSHMHTHTIPIVYQALVKIAEEENLRIRLPIEPLYLSSYSDLFKFEYYSGVVKNIIIKILLRQSGVRKTQENFIGVIYSGKMSVSRAIKGIERGCRTNSVTRVLFHPGAGLPSEHTSKSGGKLRKWHESPNRLLETKEILRMYPVTYEDPNITRGRGLERDARSS